MASGTNGIDVLPNGLPTAGWPTSGPITGTAFVPRKLRIIMIGAGISGIQLAHDVTTQLCNVELDIYEKNHNLGGTWLENRYPGCACDVPAQTYQFSWAPNPRWSKYYAPAPEILAYLNNVADQHDLRKYMHFNHRGIRAEWLEESASWKVQIEKTDAQGRTNVITRECDIFIQGTGVLNHWKWPEIEGLHGFRGQLLHTASWDTSADLQGKTIAVIGNAASAVQCVAALQPDVEKLVNYVRTPAWMLPHTFSDGQVQAEYSEEEKARFETDPEYYYQHRLKLEKILATLLESMCTGSEAQRVLASETLAHMKSKIKNEEILKHMIPEFEIGCRRHTPGDHYLKALQQDNVALITSGIVRVTDKGIIDGTGKETELDAIVCATGFDSSYEPRFPIIGKGGYALSENWGKDKATESYMAALVARFPNHFAFNPPICPVVGSLYPGIELASSYMLRILQRVQTDGIQTFCVKDEAQTEFNEWAQSRMPHMAWNGDCRSWYKNSKGKIYVPWPGTMLHYAETTSIVRWEDFDLGFINPKNKYASLGNGITFIVVQHQYQPTNNVMVTSYDLYNVQVRETLARIVDSGKQPPQAFDIKEERAHPEKYFLPCWIDTGSWENVKDYTIISNDGWPFTVRVYTPDEKKHGTGPFSVHINYHGGGFVLGDLGQEASLCARLSDGAGIVVVDVNYRLCPEATFGECFEDALASLLWTREQAKLLNINPDSLSVGGISAGGHISLVVQHLARDMGIPLRLCMVTVPVTSGVMSNTSYDDSPFQSFRDFKDDVFLSWRDMQWFAKYAHQHPVLVVPSWWSNLMTAPDLSGLSSTYIRTAEADILRDEGEAYGQRLIAAGNDVRFKRYLGMPHLFPYFEHLDANAEYVADSVQALKVAHM